MTFHRPADYLSDFLLVVIFLIVVFEAPKALADEPSDQLLTVEEVRSDYAQVMSDRASFPQLALNAIVVAEDSDFYSKAAQNSFITVQLGKRYVKQAMRTVQLRVTHYYNATILARELTHAEILNWYAQEVWLGEGCFGLADAANAYFGKNVSKLKIEELALLATLIRSPLRYHPVRARSRALERRNQILTELVQAGYLEEAEVKEALAAPLGVLEPPRACSP